MAEDELRMLIHLAINVVDMEKEFKERTKKLEETVELLHRNNATLTALVNDLLEQGRSYAVNG